MLDNLGEARAIEFTEEEKEDFSLMENFGVPLKDLKGYLASEKDARKAYNETTEGIPTDSTNNELEFWIRAAKGVNRHDPVAINGDRDAKYPAFEVVMNTMRELHENKFKDRKSKRPTSSH